MLSDRAKITEARAPPVIKLLPGENNTPIYRAPSIIRTHLEHISICKQLANDPFDAKKPIA